MQKWQHNFTDCRHEEKEEAAMLRSQAIAAWKSCGGKLLSCVLQWVQTRLMPLPMLSSKGSRKVEQFRGRCQEEVKEEGIVKMNKSKAKPVSNWRDASASSLELDLLRVRGVPGESGSAGRASKQGDRQRGPSRSPGRTSMEEEVDDNVGGLVPQTKKKGKPPGK